MSDSEDEYYSYEETEDYSESEEESENSQENKQEKLNLSSEMSRICKYKIRIKSIDKNGVEIESSEAINTLENVLLIRSFIEMENEKWTKMNMNPSRIYTMISPDLDNIMKELYKNYGSLTFGVNKKENIKDVVEYYKIVKKCLFDNSDFNDKLFLSKDCNINPQSENITVFNDCRKVNHISEQNRIVERWFEYSRKAGILLPVFDCSVFY